MFNKVLGWSLGIILIVFGLLLMISDFLTGLILIFIGLTFIPKFREFAYKKTKTNLTKNARQGLYTILWLVFIGSVIYSSIQDSQVRAEKAMQAEHEKQVILAKQEKIKLDKLRKERDERSKYFLQNKASIIEKIKILGSQKKYAEGIGIINQFIQTQDKDLLTLKQDFETQQGQVKINKRTKEILTQLKKIPAYQLEKNYNLYKELLKMHPKNSTYNQKMKHYANKIVEVEAKKTAEKLFYGEKPVQSAWNGSYRVVNRYLKQVMHDPSSLDIDSCTPVYKVENTGWIVGCRYRGKNAFGGMVLNQNWFVIRQNQVVDVKDSDTFSIK